MEKYTKIDLNNFVRKDYFQYFMSTNNILEVTVKLDVSTALAKVKKEQLCFQAYLLYSLYKSINSIVNFRYDIYDGELIEWDSITPTFSAFNKDSELFFTLYAEMNDDYRVFNTTYRELVEKYQHTNTIVAQDDIPSNIFNVSSIPGIHFDHFSSNFMQRENQIVKMFTIGQYKQIEDKILLPITIQVSHSIVDGYHISLFFERLQKQLNI